MDQPYGENPEGNNTNGDDPVVPSPQSDSSHRPERSVKPTENRYHGDHHGWYLPKQRRRICSAYLRQFRRAGADRHIELVLAAVVAGFVIAQTVNACNNNASTSGQVERIIGAADSIKDSASRFSASANQISDRVQNAVDKLQIQAEDLANGATQTGRVANETHKANENVLEVDRPWFGANLGVTNFEAGKIPMATVVFLNSGRRPAKVTLAEVQDNSFAKFPENPPYSSGTTPSIGIVVPNGTTTAQFNALKAAMPQPFFDAAVAGNPVFYIYANIEYTDIILNKAHWAHFCWRDIGNVPELARGFYGCDIYNETDQ